MTTVHTLFGLLLILIVVFLALWQSLMWRTRIPLRRVRGMLLGLLDLQVLLGVITFITHAKYGWFLLHPVIMISAVVIAHIYTKENRPVRLQRMAYIGLAVMLVAGALAGGA